MAVAPVRLNHAVLFVADLDRAERFYVEVLGMEVAAREPRANAVFLRSPRSGNHHDLGLFGVGSSAPPKQRGGIGLYHLAWQLDTIDELVEVREALRRRMEEFQDDLRETARRKGEKVRSDRPRTAGF